MFGNGFQYHFEHFCKFPFFDKLGDLGPLIYCRDTFKNTKKNKSFKKILFGGIRGSNILVVVGECVIVPKTEILEFGFLKFGNLKF